MHPSFLHTYVKFDICTDRYINTLKIHDTYTCYFYLKEEKHFSNSNKMQQVDVHNFNTLILKCFLSQN